MAPLTTASTTATAVYTAVAALINTRGSPSIVLNVGLGAGLIDQRAFCVLVVMALLTTVSTRRRWR